MTEDLRLVDFAFCKIYLVCVSMTLKIRDTRFFRRITKLRSTAQNKKVVIRAKPDVLLRAILLQCSNIDLQVARRDLQS